MKATSILKTSETNTWLIQFINEKLKSYSEDIGIAHHKYVASVFLVTCFPQKDMAERLQIKFSLLRKWLTEKKFRALVERHSEDFVNYVFQHLGVGVARGGKKKGSRDVIPIKKSLDDVHLYSPQVMDHFIRNFAEFKLKELSYLTMMEDNASKKGHDLPDPGQLLPHPNTWSKKQRSLIAPHVQDLWHVIEFQILGLPPDTYIHARKKLRKATKQVVLSSMRALSRTIEDYFEIIGGSPEIRKYILGTLLFVETFIKEGR